MSISELATATKDIKSFAIPNVIVVILQQINYDSPRGGVSVVTEKGESTTSHLLIQKATSKDSGIYVCQPLDTVKASITVHILRGKFIYFRFEIRCLCA